MIEPDNVTVPSVVDFGDEALHALQVTLFDFGGVIFKAPDDTEFSVDVPDRAVVLEERFVREVLQRWNFAVAELRGHRREVVHSVLEDMSTVSREARDRDSAALKPADFEREVARSDRGCRGLLAHQGTDFLGDVVRVSETLLTQGTPELEVRLTRLTVGAQELKGSDACRIAQHLPVEVIGDAEDRQAFGLSLANHATGDLLHGGEVWFRSVSTRSENLGQTVV